MGKQIFLLSILLITFGTLTATAQDMPLAYDVENTGVDCPEPPLPSLGELPIIETLPDPFKWSDATRGRISSYSDWRCRRAEIGAEIQHYELGTKPPPPDNLEASFSGDSTLSVTMQVNGDTLSLTAPVTIPEGKGPFPAVIGVGFSGTGSLPSDIFTSRSIATIQYNVGNWPRRDSMIFSGERADFINSTPIQRPGSLVRGPGAPADLSMDWSRRRVIILIFQNLP